MRPTGDKTTDDALFGRSIPQRKIFQPPTQDNRIIRRSIVRGDGGPQTNGGSSLYVAKAVHVDGSTLLHTDSLTTATPTTLFSYSVWFKIAHDFVVPVDNFGGQLFVVDPAGAFLPGAAFYNSSSDNGPTMQSAFGDPTNSDFISYGGTSGVGNSDVCDGTWHNFISSVDSSGSGKSDYRIDGITAFNGQTPYLNCPFNAAFNALAFYIFGDGSGQNITGDFADFWIAPNVSLLDGSGNIPTATLRKFISAGGKPVDPSGFPVGGTVLLSGDATTFGTNQIGGNPLTLTGILTNASTSPSD